MLNLVIFSIGEKKVKRLLFFLMMIGGVLFATCIVLFGDGVNAGVDRLADIFDTLADGSLFNAGITVDTMQVYGLLVFLLIDAILLISMLLMLLLNGGKLGRVRQFYTVAIWFFVGALAFSIGIGYVIYDMTSTMSMGDALGDIAWQNYVPLGAAILLLIFAIGFRKSEY